MLDGKGYGLGLGVLDVRSWRRRRGRRESDAVIWAQNNLRHWSLPSSSIEHARIQTVLSVEEGDGAVPLQSV